MPATAPRSKPAQVEISIAAHYVPRRVPFLVAALDAIASWQRHAASVCIVTNDMAIANEPGLAAAVARLEAGGVRIRYDLAHSMEHPFHLTWWHKTHLRDWYDAGGPPGDLFMYLEDDMAITEANLEYFERYLPAAKSVGAIPSFVVYENAPDGTQIAQGFRGSQLVRPNDLKILDGQAFLAPKWPYWPGFILDRELCAQYWQSPWSDRLSAAALPEAQFHSCRVHSAWALAYDTVPAGQTSRYIVAVDDALDPLPEAMVLHAAGNYAVQKTHSFGTVPVDRAFRRHDLTAKLSNFWWRLMAFARDMRVRIPRAAQRLMKRRGGKA